MENKNLASKKEEIKKKIEQLEREMSAASAEENFKKYSELEEKWLKLSADLKIIEEKEAAEKRGVSKRDQVVEELKLEISKLKERVDTSGSILEIILFIMLLPFSILLSIFYVILKGIGSIFGSQETKK